MANPWQNLVVGGIGTPKILIVGDNLFSEEMFITGEISDVNAVPNIKTPILNVDSNAFWQYMAKVEYSVTPAFQYVELQMDNTESLLGKKLLVVFRAYSDIDNSKNRVTIVVDSGAVKNTNIITYTEINRYTILTDTIPTAGNTIKIRIYGGETANNGNKIKFDDVRVHRVVSEYDFELPNNSDYLIFEEKIDGQNELNNGKIQLFNKKWKPNYYGIYDFLEKSYEEQRQYISESDLLFVMPHSDINWGFFGVWNTNLERRYFFNRYMGHSGAITIEGSEKLTTMRTKELLSGVFHVVQAWLYAITGELILATVSKYINIQEDDGEGNITSVDYFSPAVQACLEGNDITITVPSSIDVVVGGSIKTYDFVEWRDKNTDEQVSTELAYTINNLSSSTTLKVIYQLQGAEGYGTGYGTDYGDNL